MKAYTYLLFLVPVIFSCKKGHHGKKLAFSSNRNNGGVRATNMFVADWID